MQLKGSKTHDNLKAAFAGESQANRRYLYFAAKADVEGQNDVAMLFRSTAEGETGHAHGHLEFLEAVGDPATGLPEAVMDAATVTAWRTGDTATRCINAPGGTGGACTGVGTCEFYWGPPMSQPFGGMFVQYSALPTSASNPSSRLE